MHSKHSTMNCGAGRCGQALSGDEAARAGMKLADELACERGSTHMYRMFVNDCPWRSAASAVTLRRRLLRPVVHGGATPGFERGWRRDRRGQGHCCRPTGLGFLVPVSGIYFASGRHCLHVSVVLARNCDTEHLPILSGRTLAERPPAGGIKLVREVSAV
jgi:hypothetical protein